MNTQLRCASVKKAKEVQAQGELGQAEPWEEGFLDWEQEWRPERVKYRPTVGSEKDEKQLTCGTE